MGQKILDLVEWLDRWFFKKINVLSSFSANPVDTKVPSEKLVKDTIDALDTNKVDKINNKGLSTNDYDNTAKTKVDNLKTVATTGSYNDLTDKPNIPNGVVVDTILDATSDNAIANSTVANELSNFLTSHQDITGKEDVANKSSSIQNDTGSTTKYPTIKAIEDYINAINTGNVTIATVFGSPTSDAKVPSEKLVKTELDSKATITSVDDLNTIVNGLGQTVTALHTIASTGDYDDLSNTPSDLSDFNNDVGYLTASNAASTYVAEADIDFGFDSTNKEIYFEVR